MVISSTSAVEVIIQAVSPLFKAGLRRRRRPVSAQQRQQ